MNRAVFLDKDGTLIKDIPYNVDPALLILYEGAARSLRLLKDQGFLLIVVSNQSGIARGYFSENDLKAIETKIQNELISEGVQLDALYFCPHHPEGVVHEYSEECTCRKPKPGMLLEASVQFNIDLGGSWMIGDILNDVEAGNAAGCKTILIDNGNETEWEITEARMPTAVAPSLPDAVEIILETELTNYHA
jgi:D-glycero-D-manno-heptose 1,7-bisphosphate phosphatase